MLSKSMMTNFSPTERTKVRRKPERGCYDRELIYSILDEAFVCQVAFIDNGLPIVVPTNYVRVDDKLFLHGSTASRLMKTLASGAPFCLNVTLLDGIVCAPSATGHSVNYRSVVVMGKAEIVEGEVAKLAAMRDFVEYVIRDRWSTVLPPTEQELKGTMVLAVPLVEASAKVRTGFAVNDQKDYSAPAWTGVIPMKWTPQAPIPDPRGNPAIPAPANIQCYSRPQ
ncbi:MAG TPA: pyridoxamine 5'-phosphate oxidase family protein [Candidatus Dormibacteraeota bacterium]|nr:pyridoxamine 5'-phosphate oxidase family protein [Candidatus Dormibacteraeota bacterium]